jgi:tetratricopeptide (TPR) repeat protein
MASKSHDTFPKLINPEQINPTNSLELARRGWVYYYHLDYSKAREDFMQALQADSTNVDFQYGLALTLKQLGKSQEAVQVFQKILGQIDGIEDRVKATMLNRLTHAHINLLTLGNWNLGELVWQRKV